MIYAYVQILVTPLTRSMVVFPSTSIPTVNAIFVEDDFNKQCSAERTMQYSAEKTIIFSQSVSASKTLYTVS
jgi:hypothetical protein